MPTTTTNNQIPTIDSTGIKIYNDADGSTSAFQLSPQFIRPFSVWMAENLIETVAPLTSVQGGTAIYHIGQRNILEDYDSTSTPNIVFEKRKFILINRRKTLKFGFETMDFRQLGAKYVDDGSLLVSEAIMTNTIRASQITCLGYLNAKIIEARINVTKDKADQKFNLPILNADGSLYVPETPQLNSYLQAKIIIPINLMISKLTKKITREYIGVDRKKFQVQVSPDLWALLSASLTTVGSDKGYTQIENLNFTNIGGVKYIENNFLGNNIISKALDKDESFDFSNVHILIYHRDALAYPMIPKKVYQTVSPNNGNPNFIIKFAVPGNDLGETPKLQNLAIYPELFLTGNLTARPTNKKDAK